MKGLHATDLLAVIFCVLGGLLWGFVGVMGWNPLDHVFGTASILARLIYISSGLGALYTLVVLKKMSQHYR